MTSTPNSFGYADLRMGANVGVLALHGGSEGGTIELARTIAVATGASLLTFRQAPDERRHIASSAFSAAELPVLNRFLSGVDFVVSLHGHQRVAEENVIYVGGLNRAGVALIADALRSLPKYEVVDDPGVIPRALRGHHPDNPVNHGRYGGVQLELPPLARGAMPDDAPGTRAAPDPQVALVLAELVAHLVTLGKDLGSTLA